MHTDVETPSFLDVAERLFSSDEPESWIALIGFDPQCGVVVQGLKGIRKVRVGFGGRGKSGGAGVIYFYFNADLPIFLPTAFAKNEKSDLSGTDRAALTKSIDDMISNYGRAK